MYRNRYHYNAYWYNVYSAAGYGGPRQSFYGPRMPPPFQQPGNQLPQHPAAQNRMRMPGPPQSQPGYPPMYNARDTSRFVYNYLNNPSVFAFLTESQLSIKRNMLPIQGAKFTVIRY